MIDLDDVATCAGYDEVRWCTARLGSVPPVTVPHIEPMSAVSGELPADDDAWCYEPKWDGMRILIEIDDGKVRARSRTGRDVTVEFPELAGMSTIAPNAVLDAEVVALDEQGRSSFGRLQPRFGVTSPDEAAARAGRVPATIVVFDLLHLDGLDAWRLPFEQRRQLLEALVDDGPTWRRTTSARGDGRLWLDAAAEHGLEGIMAKRADRPYEPGRRSPAWRKVKLRHAQEFVVCGFTPGSGRRDGGVGALVLGCHDVEGLRWVGNVGTGLSDAELDRWYADLTAQARADAPFARPTTHRALREVRWSEPHHVVQVAYAEWTSDRRLRQPALLGRREDVDPAHVRCEE